MCRKKNDESGKRIFNFLDEGTSTESMKQLQKLVNFILKLYPAKKDQIYVGGLSMGEMGVFELVNRMPKTFAAAFPICGGGPIRQLPKKYEKRVGGFFMEQKMMLYFLIILK